MSYCSLAELKLSLRIPDTDDDDLLDLAIDAAGAAIDGYCNRTFVAAGTVVAARRFATMNPAVCQIDDVGDLTGLVIETDDGTGSWPTVWAGTDWDTEPVNSTVDGQPWPTMRLRAVGQYSFPTGYQALVRVTARWGWPDIPKAVKAATVLQAARLYKRADSPLGVAGFSDLGVMRVARGLDPDVQQLVDPYRRLGVA